MSERKSRNIFLIGYIVLTITVLLVMSSCGTSKCSNNKMVKQYSNWYYVKEKYNNRNDVCFISWNKSNTV